MSIIFGLFLDNGLSGSTALALQVKQKAKTNYYEKVLARVGGDTAFKFDFNLGGESTSITDAKYSYNWPYDHFSLVEFAKIDAQVNFEDTPFVPNLDFLPEPTDTQLLNMEGLINFDATSTSEEGTATAETGGPSAGTGDGYDLPY